MNNPSPAAADLSPDQGWIEVGDRCYARRYASVDLTIGAVLGSDGVLLIDTRASRSEADQLAADLRELTDLPVRWVVNTHWHYDHCFGNERFADAAIYGHESVPDTLAERVEATRRELVAGSEYWAAELAELTVVPPNRTFTSVAAIDLGGRHVELMHPGPAHTAGDVVVLVPDANVLYVGDLVEESGPPAYGADSHPLTWPDAVDLCVGLMTDDTVVVPGHGRAVDRAFVLEQRESLSSVAGNIRGLASEGVAIDDALGRAEWPYPAEALGEAVRRGYAALGGPARPQLPLA